MKFKGVIRIVFGTENLLTASKPNEILYVVMNFLVYLIHHDEIACEVLVKLSVYLEKIALAFYNTNINILINNYLKIFTFASS